MSFRANTCYVVTGYSMLAEDSLQNASPIEVLQHYYGYDSFRGQQAEIIDHVLTGNSALVLMPTGAGKSVCFQIPAILRSGIGIVVSPLIALMQDQVSALRQCEIRAACLNSSLSSEEQFEVYRRIECSELDLLYVAPERLMTDEFLDLLTGKELALFAIDEAHCVSQWGHDFRPEYIQLGVLAERFPEVPRLALTATADEPTRREIVDKLHLDRAKIFVGGFDRPNIEYRVRLKHNARNQLLSFIQGEYPNEAGIVYCLSRKKVDSTAEWLRERGISAYPYHAGLDSMTRKRHQDVFINEEGVVIVATIAFGMGIDKPNVRFVAHLDLPKSLEAYYQETGRAGRDSLPATAWMTYGLGDVVAVRQMIDQSEAERQHKLVEQRKLNALLGFCETSTCRRQVLLRYFGEKLAQPCNNCDTCQQPPETWDGTQAAQKLLSCCFRTGQRFGAAYLINVLRGSTDERIVRFGHDKITTFGIGSELSQAEWQSVARQLVAAGLLTVDMSGYGGLRLTQESKAALKGECTVELRKDPPTIARTKGSAQSKGKADRNFSAKREHPSLWEELRQLRLQLARKQGVPPYIIFPDSTLNEMIRQRPTSLADMRNVSGVGEKKLAAYGEAFLNVLAQ